jgi:hypothetical protein
MRLTQKRAQECVSQHAAHVAKNKAPFGWPHTIRDVASFLTDNESRLVYEWTSKHQPKWNISDTVFAFASGREPHPMTSARREGA